MKNSDGHSPDSTTIPFDSITVKYLLDFIRFGTTNLYICVANNWHSAVVYGSLSICA